MIKDTLQKEKLCRHLAAQNYYVQIEVPVFHRGGIHERRKLITDVDVFALRPNPDLSWELVLADCKTFKGQSPVNRVLWIRGLMDHFSASSGIVLLQRRTQIESDHKLFADSLRINLIDEDEFSLYDKAMVYPDGSSRYPLSVESINGLRLIHNRYKQLHDFTEYIYGYVWNEDNRIDMLRKIIGETHAVAREIDPDKREHLALILDTAGVFAVGLADCVGKIFNQYLQPSTQAKLDDALKIVIWGGKAHYDFIARLRKELLAAKGEQLNPDVPLSLPNWEDFLHLVRSMLENPKLSFSVPQILRRAALDLFNGEAFLPNARREDLLLVKYAMMTISYFCKSSRLPTQVRDVLVNLFVKRQSNLAQPQSQVKQPSYIDQQSIPELIEQREDDKKVESEPSNTMPSTTGEEGDTQFSRNRETSSSKKVASSAHETLWDIPAPEPNTSLEIEISEIAPPKTQG